jgi:uncharacterized protein
MKAVAATLTGLLLAGMIAIALVGCEPRGRTVRVAGGPAGGTFQVVAETMVGVLQPGHPGVRFVVVRSGGSAANLRAIQEERLDLGLVYYGDLWPKSAEETALTAPNVQVVARFYGAVAQLAVHAGSRITLPTQLRGARVAVGNPGSGAARAAERYFRALGIWEQIIPVYLGYDMAIAELLRGNVVAVWEMVGVPSASFAHASRQIPLRLLNLQQSAHEGLLFELYPFYQPVDIPPGTYEGQQRAVATFEDTTLLVAGGHLSRDMVSRIIDALLSEESIATLRRSHPVMSHFSAEQTLEGFDRPLHPGAAYYWRQQGRDLPEHLLPAESAQ